LTRPAGRTPEGGSAGALAVLSGGHLARRASDVETEHALMLKNRRLPMMTKLFQIGAKLTSTLIFSLLLASAASAQAPQKPEQLAQQSSDSWLALVDTGKYAESWQEASQLFKAAVTQEQWQSAVRGARTPLGKLLSRKLKSATHTKTLPGAPDGEYVVTQYDSSFEQKRSATETVTPMLDKDGKWRVSGYYIK
jgi:Protein of unknown function (DUF4019)